MVTGMFNNDNYIVYSVIATVYKIIIYEKW